MTRQRAIRAAVAGILALALAGCTAVSPQTTGHPPSATSTAATPSATSPAPTPAHAAVAANASSTPPIPESDRLLASQITCGASIASKYFSDAFNGVNGTRTRPYVMLALSNFAATPNRKATIVSARVAGSSTNGKARVTYAGALHVALVQQGTVVAVSRASTPAATVQHPLSVGETGLLSTSFAASACNGGAPLANGNYSMLAFGPTVSQQGGESVRPIDSRRTVQLHDGILNSGVTTAVGGPWGGSGVPTCGTPASQARLDAFAAQNAADRARRGLRLRAIGFTPHANAQGWDFQVRLTNTTNASMSFTENDASTAVVSGGRIVSAPDSIPIGAVAKNRRFTLKPGASTDLSSDAPQAGCGLTSDYTERGPQLPNVTHTAYIDFDVVTADGLDLVLTQRYNFHGKDRRPQLVG